MSLTQHRLAIDLGTCHTVAVVRRGGEPPRALLFDGTPLLPSGAFAGPDGSILVGRDAERMSALEPARFEPYPKRRVDEPAVLLGSDEVRTVDLLAALLRRAADEARQAGVDPAGTTVLTCPADWGAPRRGVLLAAAAAAGLGRVDLIEEPVAAATYCEAVLGRQIPDGRSLAVFDFGGGTLDVTVVRREAAGLRVMAVGGLDDLGGVDMDAALVGHLGQLIGLRDPATWRRLEHPERTGELRDRRSLWSEVRAAKEMLSRAAVAPVHVPGTDEALHLTREELERVVGPLVDRAVDETRRVLQRCGFAAAGGDDTDPTGSGLAGIFLVGGASRMPLVASRLHARFGVAPTVPEQPELPVAHGALVEAARPVASPAPVSGAPFPVSGTAQPPSGVPFPVPGVPFPVPGVPFPVPGVPRQPVGRRTGRLVAVAVAVLLVVGVATAVRFGVDAMSRGARELGSAALQGGGNVRGGLGGRTLAALPAVQLPAGEVAAVTAGGDTAYHAVTGRGETTVTAVAVADGATRWRQTVAMEAAALRLTAVGPLLIVDGDNATTHEGKDARAVLDAATGAQRWLAAWEENVDIAYLGTDALVQRREGTSTRLMRVDLLTGAATWRRQLVPDMYLNDDRISRPVLTWPSADAGAATAWPAATGGLTTAFRQPLAVDAGVAVQLSEEARKLEIVNAGNGATTASGAAPLDAEVWTTFGGVVAGARADGRGHVVAAYRLADARPAWEYPFPAGSDVERVAPCGQRLVCAAARTGAGGKVLVALDVASGAELWKRQYDSTTDVGWVVVGDRLVAGEAPFDTFWEAAAIDPAEGSVSHDFGPRPSGRQVLAASGGRLLLSGAAIAGTGTVWQLGVAGPDGTVLGSASIGTKPVRLAVMSDAAVVALTDENQVLIFRIPG